MFCPLTEVSVVYKKFNGDAMARLMEQSLVIINHPVSGETLC